jgi:HlyD family secretion protein
MNWNQIKLPLSARRPPLLVAGAVVVVLFAIYWWRAPKAGPEATAFYEVKRGDFTVTVVEGGTLGAVRETSVRNEVEGTARIIWIVPEGSFVKKGDLLVELDSAQARDQVNLQQINFERAKFAVEQAKAQFDILRSTTNSDFLAAELKLRFAKLDREKYGQGQRQVDQVEASNRVVQAEAQLFINLDTYINSTNLAAKGYETKQKVDGDRLAVLNSRNSLVVASNGIWILNQFDIPKQQDKFDSDVLQADQELQRVISQNERKMAQAQADLNAQINTLKLNEDKLQRDQKNLDSTKIYAPQDGLVVYQVNPSPFSSESLIEGGAVVRNRQELIKLPDLSRMKVTIKVHESHVNMIRPGQRAFVVLDSLPDRRFQGLVEKVAPLPDTQSRWGNPNLKVYNTEVYLSDALPNVKPGVSAKAEVIITNIADTLSVPIQAVTSLKGKPVVYLAKGAKQQPQPVDVGMFNTKFIEIAKGLRPGDRVLLSPPFDTNVKDLAGGILAEGEARGLTNFPAPVRTNMTKTGDTAPQGLRARLSPEAQGGALPDGREPRANLDQARENVRGTLSRDEKRFDKNGDGRLDQEELVAMRASLGGSAAAPPSASDPREPRSGPPGREGQTRPERDRSSGTAQAP